MTALDKGKVFFYPVSKDYNATIPSSQESAPGVFYDNVLKIVSKMTCSIIF
jgi:hypothetical protein